MSSKNKQFDLFGRSYITHQFSAIPALAIMERKAELHPRDMLSKTSIEIDGEWFELGNDRIINEYVNDIIEKIPPRVVLGALISIVNDFNFGFLSNWRGVKVPTRFLDGARSVSSANVDPLVSQLVQDGAASLRELEEYYSLEDAFKMFDIIMVKGVNQALANEANDKKSKGR